MAPFRSFWRGLRVGRLMPGRRLPSRDRPSGRTCEETISSHSIPPVGARATFRRCAHFAARRPQRRICCAASDSSANSSGRCCAAGLAPTAPLGESTGYDSRTAGASGKRPQPASGSSDPSRLCRPAMQFRCPGSCGSPDALNLWRACPILPNPRTSAESARASAPASTRQ